MKRKRTNALLIIFVFIQLYSNAQVGIFKTYEDYLDNDVIDYAGYVQTRHAAGNFKVIFLNDEGEEVKVKVSQKAMWGYRKADNRVLRIDKKNVPYLILSVGKIVVYGSYSTRIYEELNLIEYNVNQYHPKISSDLNSEMINLSKRRLRNLLTSIGASKSALLELEKTCGNYQCLYDFILKYNDGTFDDE